MKTGLFFASALVAASLTGAAVAQDVVRAEDPDSVTAFLFDQGIASKVDTDSYGDPMIQFRMADHPYTIFFYECTDNADCGSVRFYIGYETDGAVGLEQVNSLNAENRFMMAAIDDEDDVVLTMDVLTGEFGLSRNDFRKLLDVFVDLSTEFEEVVGWVSD